MGVSNTPEEPNREPKEEGGASEKEAEVGKDERLVVDFDLLSIEFKRAPER
jgi:hypothetical protein